MLSYWHSRDRAFDDRLFYLDFVDALRRLAAHRPFFSEAKRWWLALEYADEQDVARWVAAQNGASDVTYYQRQHIAYVPVIGSNGHPQMELCPARNLLDESGRPRMTRVTKWQSVSARHEDYQNSRNIETDRDKPTRDQDAITKRVLGNCGDVWPHE